MSDVGFILDRLAAQESAALFWREQAYSGSWICRQASRDLKYLQTEGVCAGAVVLLEADYSARTVAMLLALAELRTILVPGYHLHFLSEGVAGVGLAKAILRAVECLFPVARGAEAQCCFFAQVNEPLRTYVVEQTTKVGVDGVVGRRIANGVAEKAAAGDELFLAEEIAYVYAHTKMIGTKAGADGGQKAATRAAVFSKSRVDQRTVSRPQLLVAQNVVADAA